MSETHDAGTAAPEAGYEAAAEADSRGRYRETEAATEARIAAYDELPTPQESRELTWGDNPDYYDETDLADEYDGDLSAFLASQDELPTPQESRAATWGDTPEYYDETDLPAEYDGDLAALTAEDQLPARQESDAAIVGEDPVYEYDEDDLAAEYDGDFSALTTAGDGPHATQEATSGAGEHSPDDQHARGEEHDSPGADGDGQDELEPSPGELAEPRALQETAEEPGLLNGDTVSETDGRDAGETPEDNADMALVESPARDDDFTPEERARLHEAYKDYLKEYESGPTAGWAQGANVVGDRPDHSPGDTSDLPPTGEELLEMDNDKLSRFEKFRRESYEEIDDILDVSEQDSGTIQQIFDRPPIGSHAEVPVGHPVVDQPPAPGVDGGHFVAAGMVLAIIGVETARAIRHTVEKWKGRRHGGD